ncbi:DnaA ATPase domain-containing protein [Candidatus Magnetaquicoccus inordinatus]|uniref:DnaA/Hda family protein n=1 Tax=Candidatus Magnetaquicoccus inordinatus TaxID=2496818 RepID=UPI00102C48CB|nr:DnaA/Hda family protein [Candidatus Magnetaquicoccus inordinatus]
MTGPDATLLLPLPLNPVCTFANFVLGAGNRRVAEAVLAVAENRGEALLQRSSVYLLTGESGTGKSHLLQAAVAHCHSLQGDGAAIYLDVATLKEQLRVSAEQELSLFLRRHAGCRLVAIDDLEAVESSPVVQEGVLYLFNWMRDLPEGRMLVASRQSPQWMSGLRADLRSRLLWGAAMSLEAPEDALLGAILAKMLEDRQVRCSEDLRKFLQMRLPRSITDYAQAVERLDAAGLLLKRPLTVPLAKEILGL